jgi:hypothetical protein
MTIGQDGNVGIGTTSPSNQNAVASHLVIKDASSPAGVTLFAGDTTASSRLVFTDTDDTTVQGSVYYDHNVDDMIFVTSTVETMRIDSSGNVGIGTTSPTYLLQIEGDTTTLYTKSTSDNLMKFEASSTSKSNRIEFYNNTQSWFVGQPDSGNYSGNGTDFYIGASSNTPMFMIDTSGDSYTNDGSISSLSDKRGKKDIVDLEDGLDIVKQLKPVTYKHNGLIWGTDDGVTRYGFVADDILEVASQYVNIKYGTVGDEEVYDLKSISMMRMFPMLVKAIKELSAKVEALENA